MFEDRQMYYEQLHRVSPAFIKKLRADMGISLAKFANVFGVTSSQASRWENDQSYPDNVKRAMMIRMRAKLDLDRRRKKDTGNMVANLVIAGGVFALLSWLFSEDKKPVKD
jgi:transcriptional regulator with XRE-family HTH domain